jgi:acyl-CoA synthetase (AMP-forming)/AMP-acid ligase II
MQSMTEIVDCLAEEEPNRVWVKMPDSPDNIQNTSWKDITFRQLSRAVDAMAHWIDENLGGPERNSEIEPLAYMGVNDIRYPIVILAALKTGHTVRHPFLPNMSVVLALLTQQ